MAPRLWPRSRKTRICEWLQVYIFVMFWLEDDIDDTEYFSSKNGEFSMFDLWVWLYVVSRWPWQTLHICQWCEKQMQNIFCLYFRSSCPKSTDSALSMASKQKDDDRTLLQHILIILGGMSAKLISDRFIAVFLKNNEEVLQVVKNTVDILCVYI